MEQEMINQKGMIEKQRAEVLRLQAEYESTKPSGSSTATTPITSTAQTNEQEALPNSEAGAVRKRDPSLSEGATSNGPDSIVVEDGSYNTAAGKVIQSYSGNR